MNSRFARICFILSIVFLVCSCATPPKQDDAFFEEIGKEKGTGLLRTLFLVPENGDATLLMLPSGKTVLIDGGTGIFGRTIVDTLKTLGIDKLDAVILSHPDIDHYGGLTYVFDRVKVGAFYHSGLESWTPQYRRMRRSVRGSGCAVHQVRRGDFIELDPLVKCSVLWPPQDTKQNRRDMHLANTMSLVFRIEYKDVALLFTGDAKKDSEAVLVRKEGEKLRANVLKVGHHGSGSSSSEAFLKAVKPEVSVIMGEKCNLEADALWKPSDKVLRRLKEIGSRIVRTWQTGAAIVETDGKSVTKVLSAGGEGDEMGGAIEHEDEDGDTGRRP